MSLASIIFLVLFWIFAILHTAGEFLSDPHKERVRHTTKPFLMPLLIPYYFASVADNYLAVNYFIVGSVALGSIGDVVLMWPKKQAYFIVALLAFLVGHVLYVIAFLMAVQYFMSTPLLLYVALLVYAAFFAGMYRFLQPYLKDMKVPVLVYMTLLLNLSFIALAVGVSPTHGDVRQVWFPFVGSLYFISSDSLLANQNFRKSFKFDQAVIMVTYILAQFFIVQAFLV